MVVFTCNNCGESLKKNNVQPHSFKCRRDINVCCMDCLKDFNRESFNAHNQCMTELERYSGKDYVAKANQNKGQKKQEAWVDIVRSITEKKTNLSNGVSKILETISSYDNIPRKKAKFLNFMKNSFRYMQMNDLEQAWSLLEEAMKESKAEYAETVEKEKDTGKMNGNTNGTSNGKHKLLNESVDEEVNKNDSINTSEPKKKKKKKDSEEVIKEIVAETEVSLEKFSWSDTIRNILSAKNNELNLKKLKKKVARKYQTLTGGDWDEKVENKFNKKINKLKGVVVDNERVRLIVE